MGIFSGWAVRRNRCNAQSQGDERSSESPNAAGRWIQSSQPSNGRSRLRIFLPLTHLDDCERSFDWIKSSRRTRPPSSFWIKDPPIPSPSVATLPAVIRSKSREPSGQPGLLPPLWPSSPALTAVGCKASEARNRRPRRRLRGVLVVTRRASAAGECRCRDHCCGKPPAAAPLPAAIALPAAANVLGNDNGPSGVVGRGDRCGAGRLRLYSLFRIHPIRRRTSASKQARQRG